MLISPPVSEAATNAGVDPGQITRNASTNLPTFDSIYQRHTGGWTSFLEEFLEEFLGSDGLRNAEGDPIGCASNTYPDWIVPESPTRYLIWEKAYPTHLC